MVRDKLKSMMIGKSKNPQALKGTNREKTPVKYVSQPCMSDNLFESWVRSLDKEVAVSNSNRQVLLFMGNASVHIAVVDEIADELRHTKIVMLPKNTTPCTQPLDGKMLCRSLLHKHIMHKMKVDMENDPYSDVNIAQVQTWIFKPWKLIPKKLFSLFLLLYQRYLEGLFDTVK